MKHLSHVEMMFVGATATFVFTCFSIGFLWALLREKRTAVSEGVLGLALLSLALALLVVFFLVRNSGDFIAGAAFASFFGLSRLSRMLHSPRKTEMSTTKERHR